MIWSKLRMALAGGLLAGVLGGGAAAADAPAPADDPLGAARRQIEALKAGPLLPAETKLVMPELAAPALQLPSTAPAPAEPAEKRQKSQAEMKSAHWLLDAMVESGRVSDPAGRDRGKADAAAVLLSGDAAGRKEELSPGEQVISLLRELEDEASAKGGAPEPAPALANPLSDYMAGWMTSRDFDLLKPDRGPAPGGLPPPAGSPGEWAAALPALTPGPGAPARGPAPPLGDNPYLPDLTTPVWQSPPPAMPASSWEPPPVAPPPPTFAAPAEKPAPAPPDFQKRDDDAKYFPQLKRF